MIFARSTSEVGPTVGANWPTYVVGGFYGLLILVAFGVLAWCWFKAGADAEAQPRDETWPVIDHGEELP